MTRFLITRLSQSAFIIVIATVIAFLLIRLAPGEPFSYENQTPAVQQQWRAAFGFDRPVGVQLARYASNVARGRFGYSVNEHRPAAQSIADALPRTLLLAGISLVLSIIIGVAAGVFMAARHRSWWDRSMMSISTLAYSIPDFWLALIIQLILGYAFHLFPISGTADPLVEYRGAAAIFQDRMAHLAMPVITLTILVSVIVMRYQRAALLDILPSDFLRTARAKGLPERQVIRRHALRNALTPTITIIGLLIPGLLGGVYFIEYVFDWHGLGWLTVRAVQTLDYDVATASVLVSGVLVAVGSLVADLLLVVVDPRTRDAS
jgi:peptide/nickel transport system permease protein